MQKLEIYFLEVINDFFIFLQVLVRTIKLENIVGTNVIRHKDPAIFVEQDLYAVELIMRKATVVMEQLELIIITLAQVDF